MTANFPDYAYEIVGKAMGDIVFDGWTMAVIKQSARDLGYDGAHIETAFPNGISEAICCYARFLDQKMLTSLEGQDINSDDLSTRGRIATALEARFAAIDPLKEVERQAVGVMMHPKHMFKGKRSAWATADTIWEWAGDTSDDYNHYTKRILLSGVIVKTTLFYLQDESNDFVDTKDFMRRQLDQVVARGKTLSKAKPILDGLWSIGQRFRSKR